MKAVKHATNYILVKTSENYCIEGIFYDYLILKVNNLWIEYFEKHVKFIKRTNRSEINFMGLYLLFEKGFCFIPNHLSVGLYDYPKFETGDEILKGSDYSFVELSKEEEKFFNKRLNKNKNKRKILFWRFAGKITFEEIHRMDNDWHFLNSRDIDMNKFLRYIKKY